MQGRGDWSAVNEDVALEDSICNGTEPGSWGDSLLTCSGTFSHYGDVARVAAEAGDMLLYPAECGTLVEEAVVGFVPLLAQFLGRQQSWKAETVAVDMTSISRLSFKGTKFPVSRSRFVFSLDSDSNDRVPVFH